jgi:hypothetical protein
MLETGRRPDRAFESFLGNIDDNYPRRHKAFWINRQKEQTWVAKLATPI